MFGVALVGFVWLINDACLIDFADGGLVWLTSFAGLVVWVDGFAFLICVDLFWVTFSWIGLILCISVWVRGFGGLDLVLAWLGFVLDCLCFGLGFGFAYLHNT